MKKISLAALFALSPVACSDMPVELADVDKFTQEVAAYEGPMAMSLDQFGARVRWFLLHGGSDGNNMTFCAGGANAIGNGGTLDIGGCNDPGRVALAVRISMPHKYSNRHALSLEVVQGNPVAKGILNVDAWGGDRDLEFTDRPFFVYCGGTDNGGPTGYGGSSAASNDDRPWIKGWGGSNGWSQWIRSNNFDNCGGIGGISGKATLRNRTFGGSLTFRPTDNPGDGDVWLTVDGLSVTISN